MKGIRIALALFLLAVFAGVAGVLLAQEKAPHAQPTYVYNTADQVTLEGTVEEAKDYKCPISGTVGAHITIKTGSDTLEVHLAPATFMKDYEMVLHPGDKVKIVGAKIQFEGKPALLAKTLKVGQETFTFRDEKGKPLW
jgi:uncharacterized protein YdeI (BOF family)